MHNNTICCDMYPTDDAAHEAALRHFEGNHNDH